MRDSCPARRSDAARSTSRSSGRSRTRSAMRSRASPVWRVPSSSPGPRISRSPPRDLEPVGGRAQHLQARARRPGQGSVVHHHAGAASCAAADPAAQLVELGESEALRVLDDHERRVGDVHPDLDHRGRHEHVGPRLLERRHRRVLLRRRHPAVHQPDAQIGRASASSRAVSSAARHASASDSSMVVQTQYACSPPAHARRMAGDDLGSALRRRHRGVHRSSPPGGSSSITETSRSAYAVIASVRGMGVAVMMS